MPAGVFSFLGRRAPVPPGLRPLHGSVPALPAAVSRSRLASRVNVRPGAPTTRGRRALLVWVRGPPRSAAPAPMACAPWERRHRPRRPRHPHHPLGRRGVPWFRRCAAAVRPAIGACGRVVWRPAPARRPARASSRRRAAGACTTFCGAIDRYATEIVPAGSGNRASGQARRIPGRAMPPTLPFHSASKGAPRIFHTNDECYLGRSISGADWRPGESGDFRQCPECARLSAQERPPFRSF